MLKNKLYGHCRVLGLLLLSIPTLGTAVTPVDGRSLAQPAEAGKTVAVTLPAPVGGHAMAAQDWSEGCLKDPAGAERLRQLHLGAVNPLALAMDSPVGRHATPEWASCR